MKWKDLSLKERKQIYDSVRVNNPDATYLDIKQQFDSIPAYEDGKGKTINKADLPPEYRTGTPEYFERQRKISGAVNTVQPEAYITPAGYIKDAVNFIEDLGKGDHTGVAIDAVLNLIPWGVGKGIKKLKSKVGRIIEQEISRTIEQEISRTTDKDGYGQINIKNIKDNVLPTDINDYNVILDNNIYMPGTANHELGHVADGLAGSRKIQDFDSGKEYITNTYLNYMENLYPVYPIPSYKDGGIHIKKKNRGKFNALKKRTGKSTEELTHSKNPLTRKRAIFAQNAAKWNHKGRKKK